MHLILCHQTADFDALGAAVGLSKLHANAKIVLPGGAHRGVKRFLSLYRDELALIERRSVNPKTIQHLSIVDNQRRDRLGKAAEWLDLPHLQSVAIYDHHGDHLKSDIAATHLQIEPVGATTTLIVEKLQAAGATLSIAEATVMALGIHVDTGSLTNDQTTVRDAQALTWLLLQGANVATVRNYIDPGLTPELQRLLAQALEDVEIQTVPGGYQIASLVLQTEKFVPGLSSLAERLVDLTDCHGLLLGHFYHRRSRPEQHLTIIGRSRLPHSDLAALFAPYGGGGHAQAASVTMKTERGEAQFHEILHTWIAQIPAPLTARDLMSAPVRTIRPETTIAEAQRILLRYGHSGLSVVDEQDALVGVISRRDLDLALHHGFGHAPAKAYMSRDPHTIAPDTSLPDIEAMMVTYDVGRLPVMEGGNLVGIVTRTDVLRQRLTAAPSENATAPELTVSCPIPQPHERIAPPTWQLLQRLARAAEARGWHLYIVGGVVRDLLLQSQQGQGVRRFEDIDLVVDGFHRAAQTQAGVELAKAVRQWYPEAKLEIHGAFQTATLLWHKEPELGSLALDIATARTEFYPYPAANPEVEASSIRQDLYRRDFTINAMALRLTQPRAGEILDFFGGVFDLRSRQIRVLHANSFIEDPTRIYRAVRFAVRLGFTIETQTEQYIHYAIASGIYARSLAKYPKAPALTTRLRAELKYILTSAYWQPALQLLDRLNALQCLQQDLHLTPQLWRQIRGLDRGIKRFDPEYKLCHWHLRLELILLQLPTSEAVRVAQNLHLAEAALERLDVFPQLRDQLQQMSCNHARPSEITYLLKSHSLEILSLLLACVERPARHLIWQYLTNWSHIKPLLNGNDLKTLGYPRGPHYRVILEDVLAKTLDGVLTEKEDAIAYVQRHYRVHPTY